MRRSFLASTVSYVFVMAFCLVGVASAQAQIRAGVQAGASIEPDQVYIGGHALTQPLAPNVRFRPGVDFGFGDDVTLTSINLEVTYSFASRRPWNLYAGGGPAIAIYHVDGFGTDTQAGFNIIIGAQHTSGLFAEMKIGAIDSPDLRFGVGYTFK